MLNKEVTTTSFFDIIQIVNNKIEIGFLKDHTQFIDEVAVLWHQEWGGKLDESDLPRKRVSVRGGAQRGKLPFIIVAIIGGELAGSASLFENDLENRPELTPWLAAVVTKYQFRGKGIAEKLSNAIVIECKRLGYRKIYLRTEKADEYFKHLGWTLFDDTKDENAQPTRVYFKEI